MAMFSVLTFVIVMFSVCLLAQGVSWEDSYNQMNATLTGYDTRHRPILDQSKAIQVNISFDLVALQEFDEVNEKFSVVVVVYLTWFDEKLTWNPFFYDGLWSQLYTSKDVWYPIMLLANPYVEIEDFVKDWMTIRVFPNGYALFAPGSVFKSTCSVDVTYYPFDTQECHLLFVAWGYSSDELYFYSTHEAVQTNYFSENGIWDFIGGTTEAYTSNGSTFVIVKFKLKRKPLFLVVNVLLPIVFMSMINILVFMLPPESGERVSFATTVLLAIAVFLTLVGDNIPKTSKPMSILCYFLMIELIMSTLMCVSAILNLRLYFKKPADSVPAWCRYVTRVLNCNFRINRGKRTVKNNPDTTETLRKNVVQPFNTRFNRDNNIMTTVERFEGEELRTTKCSVISVDTDIAVTWKEVSQAVDKVCIGLFLLAMAIVNGIFLSILSNNKQP